MKEKLKPIFVLFVLNFFGHANKSIHFMFNKCKFYEQTNWKFLLLRKH